MMPAIGVIVVADVVMAVMSLSLSPIAAAMPTCVVIMASSACRDVIVPRVIVVIVVDGVRMRSLLRNIVPDLHFHGGVEEYLLSQG